jgi:hypothetical protein
MQTTPLARYGAPIAIVAGALMIITRLVVPLHHAGRDCFHRSHSQCTHRVEPSSPINAL